MPCVKSGARSSMQCFWGFFYIKFNILSLLTYELLLLFLGKGLEGFRGMHRILRNFKSMYIFPYIRMKINYELSQV